MKDVYLRIAVFTNNPIWPWANHWRNIGIINGHDKIEAIVFHNQIKSKGINPIDDNGKHYP